MALGNSFQERTAALHAAVPGRRVFVLANPHPLLPTKPAQLMPFYTGADSHQPRHPHCAFHPSFRPPPGQGDRDDPRANDGDPLHYSWPGNTREAQNLIERAVLLSPGSVLHVPLKSVRDRAAHVTHKGCGPTLADWERELILATMKEAEWVVSGPKGAASRLGINRSTLQVRMRKLGIVRPDLMWVKA